MDVLTAITSSVIFLFTEGGKVPLGTGFIVAYPVPEKQGQVVPLVVTAKHVLGDLPKVVARYTTKTGKTGSVTYDLVALRREGDLWEHPSDDGVDIVVFRTPHFEEVEYSQVPMDIIASKEVLVQQDIKVTDRIIFPFLLVNFMGQNRNYPVMRNGTIALIPDESIPLEYDVGSRRVKTSQPLMLVDATSIPGASGAPVFLYPGPRLQHGGFTVGAYTPFLLGIMHGFYPALPREVTEAETKASSVFAENSGIALVFPSWRLLEILHRPEVDKRIRAIAQQ